MARRDHVKSYINNLGKTLTYAGKATIRSTMPILSNTVENNATTVQSGLSYTRQFLSSRGESSTSTSNMLGRLMNDVREIKKNAFEDLKTGKFKNFDREMQATENAFGMDEFGIDWGTGGGGGDGSSLDLGDDFDPDEPSSNDLASTAAAIRTSAKVNEVGSNLRTKAIMDTVATSAEESANYIVRSNTKLQSIKMNMTSQMHTETVKLMGNTNTLLQSLVSFNTEQVTAHMDKQLSFFDNVLEELRGIKEALNPQPPTEQRKTSGIEEVFGFDGSFDLAGYGGQIKKNIDNLMTSSGLGLLTSLKGMGVSPIDALKSSPISFIAGLIGSGLMPKTLKDSLGKLDTSISGLFATLALQINKAKSGTGVGSLLASIFGIDINPDVNIDPSRYNREAIAFNGKTQKAITEVIPTLLSGILSAINGNNRIALYDYKTGKFTDARNIINENRDRISSSRRTELSDTRDSMMRSLSSIRGGSSEAMSRDLDNFLDFLSSYDGVYNPMRDTNIDELRRRGLKLDNPRTYDALRAAFMNMPKHLQSGTNMSILRSRLSASRTARTIEDELQESGLSAAYSDLGQFLGPESRSGGFGGPVVSLLQDIKNVLVDGIIVYGGGRLGDGDGRDVLKRRDSNRASITSSTQTRVSPDVENMVRGGDDSLDDIITMPFEAMQTTMASFSEADDIVDKTFNRPSFLDGILKERNMGRRIKMLKDKISSPGQFISGLIGKMDSMIYRIIYGRESSDSDDGGSDPTRNRGSIIGRLSVWINSAMDRTMKFMDKKILSPIHEKFFGEEGLFNKFMTHFQPFLDNLREGFSTGKDKLRDFLLGAKDARGIYTGGALSDVGNMFVDFGNSMRNILTGGSYLRSDGVIVGENKENVFTYIKSYSKTLVDHIKVGMFGEKEEIIDENGNVTHKYKGDGVFSEVSNQMREIMGVIKGLFVSRDGESVEDVDRAVEDWKGEFKGFLPKGLAGGLSGAVAGTLLLPAGGPMLWGLLGSTAAFASHSQKFRERLFGNEEEGVEGLIPERYVNGFKKFFPAMAAGGSMGALAGLTGLLPGGMMSWMLIGSTLAYIQKSESAQDALFGKTDEDGNIITKGLLPNDMREKIKKYFPTAAAGGLIGAGASLIPGVPGSPLLGLALGATMAYVRKSDEARTALFGEKDEDGNIVKAGKLSPQMVDTIKRIAPKVAIGGILGVGLGGLLGLPGGVALWSILGTSLAFTKKANTVQDVLFGKAGNDDEEDTEGLVPKIVDRIKRMSPSLKIGGGIGLAAAALLPGGLPFWLMMGTSLAMARKATSVQEMLFGKQNDENEDVEKGFLAKMKEKFGSIMPNTMGGAFIGAVSGGLGLFGGGGPLVGAAVGATLAITGISGAIKKFVLGRFANKDEPEDGEAIMDKIEDSVTDNILDPLNDKTGKKRKGIWGLLKTVGGFLWRESTGLFIRAPLIIGGAVKDATLDITKALFERTKFEMKFLMKKIGESVKESVNYLWERAVKYPFMYMSNKIKEWIGAPLEMVGNWIKDRFKTFIGDPLMKAFSWIGDKLKNLFLGDGDDKGPFTVRIARFFARGIRGFGRDFANFIRGPLGPLEEKMDKQNEQAEETKDVSERIYDAVSELDNGFRDALNDSISPKIDESNALLRKLVEATRPPSGRRRYRKSKSFFRGGAGGKSSGRDESDETISEDEIDGSHYSGIDYVPYDDYIARLHKGEKVVPARDARHMRDNSGDRKWRGMSRFLRRIGQNTRRTDEAQTQYLINTTPQVKDQNSFNERLLGLLMQSSIALTKMGNTIKGSGNTLLDWLSKVFGNKGLLTGALLATLPFIKDFIVWLKDGGFGDIVQGILGLGENREERTYTDEDGEEQFIRNDTYRESLFRAGYKFLRKGRKIFDKTPLGRKLAEPETAGKIARSAANLGRKASDITKSTFRKLIDSTKLTRTLATDTKIITTMAKDEAAKMLRAITDVVNKFFTDNVVVKKLGSSNAGRALKKVVEIFKSIFTNEFVSRNGHRLARGLVKTAGKGALAFVTGGISALAFGIWDGVTGMIEASNTFEVDRDDVTWKMRIVAAAIKVFFGFAPILSVIAEIVAEQAGFNLKKQLATAIHAAFSDIEEIGALEDAQDDFVKQWKDSGMDISFQAWNDKENRTVAGRIADGYQATKRGVVRAGEWGAETAGKVGNWGMNVASKTGDAISGWFGKGSGTPSPSSPTFFGRGPGDNITSSMYLAPAAQSSSNVISAPHISQEDPMIRSLPFGRTNDTIGDSGCAPVVAAMALSALTGTYISVSGLANLAASKGFKRGYQGTDPKFFKYLEKEFNVKVTELSGYFITESVINALSSKRLVILAGGGPNNPMGEMDISRQSRHRATPFGKSAHYVLAVGFDSRKNQIYVNDPLSPKGNEIFELMATLATTTRAFVIEQKVSGRASVFSNPSNMSFDSPVNFGKGGVSPGYQAPSRSVEEEYGYALRAPKSDMTAADLSMIDGLARQYNINPHIWLALVEYESQFNSKSRSGSSSASGWGQVLRDTGKWLYESKLRLGTYNHEVMGTDKRINAMMSMYYLADLIKRFGLEKGIMAYNVGEGTVSRGQTVYKNENANTYLSRVTANLNKNTGKSLSGSESIYSPIPQSDSSSPFGVDLDQAAGMTGLAGLLGEVSNIYSEGVKDIYGFDPSEFGNTFAQLATLADPFADMSFGSSKPNMVSSNAAVREMTLSNTGSLENLRALYPGFNVTSLYGSRSDPIDGTPAFHTGIDLVKAHRSPILSFTNGKVVFSAMGQPGSGYGGYGNVVAVKDENNHTHLYAHLDTRSVSTGETVRMGQEVGKQGTTGRSTGSHLHYEVRSGGYGTHIDPSNYLQQYLGSMNPFYSNTSNVGGTYMGVPDANEYVERVSQAVNRHKGGPLESDNPQVIKLLTAIATGVQSLVGISEDTKDALAYFIGQSTDSDAQGDPPPIAIIREGGSSDRPANPLIERGRKSDKSQSIQAIVAGVPN